MYIKNSAISKFSDLFFAVSCSISVAHYQKKSQTSRIKKIVPIKPKRSYRCLQTQPTGLFIYKNMNTSYNVHTELL
jgi:hypothetical protein